MKAAGRLHLLCRSRKEFSRLWLTYLILRYIFIDLARKLSSAVTLVCSCFPDVSIEKRHPHGTDLEVVICLYTDWVYFS